MATARQLPADVYPETLSALAAAETRDLERGTAKGVRRGDGATFGTLESRGHQGAWRSDPGMPKLAKSLGDVNRMLRSELGLDERLVELTILPPCGRCKASSSGPCMNRCWRWAFPLRPST